MIIRVMGEIDIHSFDAGALSAQPPGIASLNALQDRTDADLVNWLGRTLDNPGANPLDDADLVAEIEAAASYCALSRRDETGTGDFVLLLVLRQRWPVGSKARFRAVAERVGADHTYLLLACPAQTHVSLDDDDSLSKAEAGALQAMVPILKKNRKQFAASSGLQQFLQQLG